MRWPGLVLLTLLFAVLALRWPPQWTTMGLAPCWLLFPALWFGLYARAGRALAVGWVLGLLADLLSLEPLGVQAFLYAGAALLLARARGFFFRRHPLTQALLALTAAFLVQVLLLLRLNVAEPSLAVLPRLLPALCSAMLYAALFPGLVALERRTGLFRGFREGEVRVST